MHGEGCRFRSHGQRGFVDGSGAGRFGHRNPRSPGVQTEHRQVLTPPVHRIALTPPVHRIACQLATALVAWVDHELGPAHGSRRQSEFLEHSIRASPSGGERCRLHADSHPGVLAESNSYLARAHMNDRKLRRDQGDALYRFTCELKDNPVARYVRAHPVKGLVMSEPDPSYCTGSGSPRWHRALAKIGHSARDSGPPSDSSYSPTVPSIISRITSA